MKARDSSICLRLVLPIRYDEAYSWYHYHNYLYTVTSIPFNQHRCKHTSVCIYVQFDMILTGALFDDNFLVIFIFIYHVDAFWPLSTLITPSYALFVLSS